MRAIRGEITMAVPSSNKCRKLITQGFTSPCWHQNKRILAIEYIGNDGFLVSLKAIKAKVFF